MKIIKLHSAYVYHVCKSWAYISNPCMAGQIDTVKRVCDQVVRMDCDNDEGILFHSFTQFFHQGIVNLLVAQIEDWNSKNSVETSGDTSFTLNVFTNQIA